MSPFFFYLVAGAFATWMVYRAVQRRSVPRVGPEEAADRVKQGKAILLDVRSDSEFRGGAIKGASHIPLQTLRARIDELKKSAQKEIICYCGSGNRSVSAALTLRGKGFQASSLDGGIGEWNFVHRQHKHA
jgi:phage shock protein E